MKPSITVVTPWWNHPELARDYWMAMRLADCEVLVIDNASRPPLPNAYRLPSNTGFSHACNVGLQLARTDAVLFLNNDVAVTEAGWLEPLRAALDSGVLVGAGLRRDRHADVDGQPMPYLDGWCLAGMREDLVALGGFDESLDEPSYYSDNLLCLEARAAGMSLREARVGLRHKLNASAVDHPAVRAATDANYLRYRARARELLGVVA